MVERSGGLTGGGTVVPAPSTTEGSEAVMAAMTGTGLMWIIGIVVFVVACAAGAARGGK